MDIPSLRRQAAIRDAWLLERLETIVPMLMERSGMDTWVLSAREYNEDPVVQTMLPADWLSARRRTILLFLDRGRRRLAVTRYAVGEGFEAAWDPAEHPDQWGRVAELLVDADPATIAVNRSATFALADGMSSAEHEAFTSALPASLHGRVVPGEPLAIGWLETRMPNELPRYEDACGIAHSILRRGLSREAIEPGVTTTADLEWWYRQQVRDVGLRAWFHPSVSVQRAGSGAPESFATHPAEATIQHRDLVHVDFGIEYLGLHTDQQEHAYVLGPGEEQAPAGLTTGLHTANRLQDILTAEFVAGRTGNEILAAALHAAAAEGIDAAIYTHPIGLHGHGAGPTIGLWDQQGGVSGQGDYPLHPHTAFSIELSARVPVPEWGGQQVRFMLEQDAFFDGSSVAYFDGRQQELWLV